MKHGNIRMPEVVNAFGLKEIRNNIHAGLLFKWKGQQYVVIFPAANMSSGRPVALGRVETAEVRQFERNPSYETYCALLEDEGRAIERAIARIDGTGALMQLIWDVLYCVGLFGYNSSNWSKTGMEWQDVREAEDDIKHIEGRDESTHTSVASGCENDKT